MINAPLIWILIPFMFSIFIWFIRKRRVLALYLTSGITMFLGLAAATLKIGEVFTLGPVLMEIDSSFTLLGRSFVFQNDDRFVLAIIFIAASIWFSGSRVSGANEYFLPIGLAVIALLLAALSVEPFLYAALFIEFAVLLSIPMLFRVGDSISNGVMRYLVFQTIALPLVLLAGWAFEQAPFSANSDIQFFQASLLLGFGFALWLGIFPFHSWLPMISEEGQPYVFAFMVGVFSTTVLILSMDFFNSYSWLREDTTITDAIKIIGIIMIMFGGGLAVFQNKLSRLVGYAYMYEIGFSILAIGINSSDGWLNLLYSILPRLLSLMIFSLVVSLYQNNFDSDDLNNLKGSFYRFPFLTITLLIAWFSISGLPLLAGFPVKIIIFSLVSAGSFTQSIWIGLGFLGTLLMGGRLLLGVFSFLGKKDGEGISVNESIIQLSFLSLGSLILIIFGLFPGSFMNIMTEILSAYQNLN